MESAFAKPILKAWLEGNQEVFVGILNSKDIDTPRGRAARIQRDLPSHNVGISAWDQGNGLGIIMIDIAADEAKVRSQTKHMLVDFHTGLTSPCSQEMTL